VSDDLKKLWQPGIGGLAGKQLHIKANGGRAEGDGPAEKDLERDLQSI